MWYVFECACVRVYARVSVWFVGRECVHVGVFVRVRLFANVCVCANVNAHVCLCI